MLNLVVVWLRAFFFLREPIVERYKKTLRAACAKMLDAGDASDDQGDFEMALPVATLDHVVINARDDMDRAADIYRNMGFTLTERGYHSLGSMNHLAMFGTDYLELIAIPKGASTGRMDLLQFPAGLNGLVFGSEDSTVTYNELAKAGVPIEPPVEFTRPVKVDGKDHDARFRTVRMKNGVVPYGRVYYCHHFTRDLVWRDEWRHHANGTVAVTRALIVEPDPAAAAKLYASMFGPDNVRDIKGGKTVIVGNSRFDIVTEATLKAEFGDCAPDAEGRKAYMAGLTFRTVSLAKAAAALKAGKIAGVVQDKSRVVVPAKQAFNAVLEFIE